jgi:hypothetical protein
LLKNNINDRLIRNNPYIDGMDNEFMNIKFWPFEEVTIISYSEI